MNNLLNKISNIFGFLGGRNESSAVGIDIGSSAIKIVEIKRKGGKAILETYGSISLGSYAETDVGRVTNLPVDKVAEALKEVLKQSGTTTSLAAFSIPVQSSLIFSIDLPSSIKESEFSQIIPTEARKYIPVPVSEVSLDYFISPKKETSFEEASMNKNNPGELKSVEKTNVLVVATQKDITSRYRSIVSQCFLTASFFEIEIFSSIRSNFEHELSPVLLIDFGASRTKLSVVELGMVKSYHTIDRGGADISDSISKSLSIPFSEAEKMKKNFGLLSNQADNSVASVVKTHVDYIFGEAGNVLLAYEKKYNRAISKIIFTGGGALMKGLKEAAVTNFKSEIEIGTPFTKVNAPEFLEKVLESIGPEFSVALGLALRKLQ
jgi:type IV pilus assembly protein PilM